MKGRFLFTSWPFEGHMFPQVAVASALRDRGHEVAFYTGEAARATVVDAGFKLFPFRRVDNGHWQGVHALNYKVSNARQSRLVGYQAFRRWLVESIPGQVADLQEILQTRRPDVIVTDPAMWGPVVILSESTSIPVALMSNLMGPLTPGRDAPPWGLGLKPPRTWSTRALAWLLTRATDLVASGIRRRVNEFRAEHGLPPIQGSINAFTGRLPLYLVGNLPELDFNRLDLPPSVHYVGPYLWHPRPEAGTAAWLEALPTGRPWVHVTEGTSQFQDPFLLRAAVLGLAGQPVEVIVTTGRQRDPEGLDLGPRPANVHIRAWLNYSELLPRCSTVVTTGGAGTVLGSLRAGVPLVVVPTNWDQPDNARRVVEAGVGVRLAPRRCTPERLRAAVELVLGEPSYRNNARGVAERLAGAPGPARAAELLEGLADEGSGPGMSATLPDVVSSVEVLDIGDQG